MSAESNSSKIKAFTRRLRQWGEVFPPREMPWRGERDPYRIWLSEVILQQTRVEQGRGYYERFCVRFPTVKELAKASEAEVFKLWEGLGYYARARNLHATAQHIYNERKGQFPDHYDALLRLKGIGPYTAAAIASFAYREPRAVVDGNVIRVLARVFGIAEAPVTAAAKKTFQQLADNCLDQQHPDKYNQAIMDFGAQVCTPRSPRCEDCPLQAICFAKEKNLTDQLPVTVKKAPLRHRHFHYLVIYDKKDVLLQQRTEKDIWKGLWEFPLLEEKGPTLQSLPAEFRSLIKKKTAPDYQAMQLLSHQRIHSYFYLLPVKAVKDFQTEATERISFGQVKKKSFPVSLRNGIRTLAWPGSKG